jgi:multidrug transporter EmrE-like cation transporter
MAIVAQSSKYGQISRTLLAWIVGLLFFFPSSGLFSQALRRMQMR